MPRLAQETEALFDGWATTYDDDDVCRPTGVLIGYQQSLHRAAAMIPLATGADVLDVGIGTGAFAGLLAARGVRVSGSDVSEPMLARCHAKHPSFALAKGSFLGIPHADCQFDALVSSFTFHEVSPEERPLACTEAARVLRTGGHICLLDIVFASPPALTAAFEALRPHWDPDEDYPLVGELDTCLHTASFSELWWQQTAAYH